MSSLILYTLKLNVLPNNSLMSIGQLFFFIVAFVIVLFLAVYITRLLATSSYLKLHNKNIKILESIGVGHQNSIQLIKVGEKYILIGNTKEKITFLLDLEEDDIVLQDEINQKTTPSSFKESFDKYLKKKYADKGDNNDEVD